MTDTAFKIDDADAEDLFRAGQTLLRVVHKTGRDRDLEAVDVMIGELYDICGLRSDYCACDAVVPVRLLKDGRCPVCREEGR